MSSNRAVQFSPKEMETLALAWQCMESQPKIDMTKLARLTGYTPGSASVTFGKIKQKLKLLSAECEANGPAAPKTPAGSASRRPKSTATPKSTGKRGGAKNASQADDADDDEDEVNESPTKRAKKSSTKKRSTDSDDDEEFAVPKIKKEEVNDVQSSAEDFWDRLNGSIAHDGLAGAAGMRLTKEGRRKRAAKTVRVPGLAEAFRRVIGR